jgi:hypothetical protein
MGRRARDPGDRARFRDRQEHLRLGQGEAGFRPTRDVVIVDAELAGSVETASAPAELADHYARQSGWDPRDEPAPYVYLLMRPVRIQAWREANELEGRTIMRDGVWLY